ncbi:hypothetical protein B0H16DRAFT_715197 [Mycena metata]|uniref:Uncharacterized protein n=1 Tax=Mycena metata TaxID=1033252 RepID=A0AAD7NBZ6_9AGAR|nr:hypothetical protein B0H16DRAFT_715197 [Mycena metata]
MLPDLFIILPCELTMLALGVLLVAHPPPLRFRGLSAPPLSACATRHLRSAALSVLNGFFFHETIFMFILSTGSLQQWGIEVSQRLNLNCQGPMTAAKFFQFKPPDDFENPAANPEVGLIPLRTEWLLHTLEPAH